MANVLKYPFDLESNALYSHYISFKNTVHQKQTTKRGHGATSVHLYLPPDALKTSYSQSYADTDLGAVGNVINQIDERQVGAVGDAIASGSVGRMIEILKGVGADDATKTAITNAAARDAVSRAGAISAGATAAIQKRLGQVVNPFKAVIYNGPGGFRTFTFTFVMQPESSAEATTVKKIVRYFKFHMHPGVSDLSFTKKVTTGGSHQEDRLKQSTDPETRTGSITSSAMLTYPDTFMISMFPNKQPQSNSSKNSLFKIKECFLESFNVDYSTSGGPAFFDDVDGSPVTTTVSMQFKETELLTRNSIAQGF
tara:strand:+ start:7887 stop:8819 length:933 start_codon:yes stop_codon:yes gene_type:complete